MYSLNDPMYKGESYRFLSTEANNQLRTENTTIPPVTISNVFLYLKLNNGNGASIKKWAGMQCLKRRTMT